MYKLYTITGSCSTGIHILLNKLDIPVDVIKRDDVPNYQSLVPTNQVPALQLQEHLITEGAAIVLHLFKQHGNPYKNVTEEEFIQWLMFNYATLHPAYSKLFAVLNSMNDSTEKQTLMESFADKLIQTWKIVDARLAKQPYMLGDTPSIVDYLLAIYLGWGKVFPSLSIPVGEHVLRVVNEVMLLPEFIKAFDVEGGKYQIPHNAY